MKTNQPKQLSPVEALIETVNEQNRNEARRVVKIISDYQSRFKKESGEHFALSYAIGVIVGAWGLREYSVFTQEVLSKVAEMKEKERENYG